MPRLVIFYSREPGRGFRAPAPEQAVNCILLLLEQVHILEDDSVLAVPLIEELPEGATWGDIQERINFVAGVRKSLQELDEGKGIPHETVREEFAQWLTG